MTQAVEVQSKLQSSSSDVFGNDLGDVDIWGESSHHPVDSKPNGSGGKHVIMMNEVRDAAHRMQKRSESIKPPRTPLVGRRKLHAELLQHRSPEKQPVLESPHVAKMSARMRMRKMGRTQPYPTPQVEEPPPEPKPLSVAEKRRLRHQELSSRALNVDAEDGNHELED